MTYLVAYSYFSGSFDQTMSEVVDLAAVTEGKYDHVSKANIADVKAILKLYFGKKLGADWGGAPKTNVILAISPLPDQ